MSEYVVVEAEPTDDPNIMTLYVNQPLTNGTQEHYADRDAAETGSPLAQSLVLAVEGIHALEILPDSLVVTRAPNEIWEPLIDDIRDVLRDFFL